MVKTKKVLLVCFIALFGLLYGCDGLLDTDPAASIDPEVAQANIEGMESLAVSIHSRLRAYGRYGNVLVIGPDVMADNTDQHPTTSGRYDSHAINQPGSHLGNRKNSTVDYVLWNTNYRSINESNFIIEGIDQLEGVSDEQRNRLLGESYMLRALAYHDLVRVFAYEPGQEVNGWDEGVIIRTEPTRDVGEADDIPRSSNQEVYDLIVNDLELAIQYLEGNDRGVYYANYESALALMARVQLYLGNWQDALDYATLAMESTGAGLVNEAAYAENIFESAPNPESVFELNIDPSTEGLSSNDAIQQYITPSGWFDVVPSQNLLDLYDENDVRLALYAEHTDGYPYILKFNASSGTYTDNIPLIRYPELLFIRAEANAELGDEASAIEDLETLRTARGLEGYIVPPTGDELILEIFDERRRELAFEGHRWFDLKRRGMDIPKQGDLSTISYQDHRILAPLPSSEVEDFENVVQNPGY